MTDKPYQGRKAGSFIKDKDTGKLRRADVQSSVPVTETAKPAQPAKKGKQ